MKDFQGATSKEGFCKLRNELHDFQGKNNGVASRIQAKGFQTSDNIHLNYNGKNRKNIKKIHLSHNFDKFYNFNQLID